LAVTGPRHARAQAKSRRRIIVPVALAALAAIALAAVAFVVVDRGRSHPTEPKPKPSATPAASPAPSPGSGPLPVVVVGANCATLGTAGLTQAGAPAYCAHLTSTNAAIWSLYPGEVSTPTLTAGPHEQMYPSETESPVLVCMEQTGQSRVSCHDDILQSNGSASATPPP
jgi:serine/threonine-protein kinase